eukprot:771080-Rhodomonas_salina.6
MSGLEEVSIEAVHSVCTFEGVDGNTTLSSETQDVRKDDKNEKTGEEKDLHRNQDAQEGGGDIQKVVRSRLDQEAATSRSSNAFTIQFPANMCFASPRRC